MSDFYQNGVITNFHNLNQRSLEDLERELVRCARRRPMGLILPSLYSELEGPALSHIVDELARVPYLNEIIIGLDRADRDQFLRAREFFSRLPQHHRILWNDGPRLRALDAELQTEDLAPSEPGKGRNVWYCGGYAQISRRTEAVALHDCDIVTYDRGLLARLIYPVANPQFNYEFCKGYYPRIADGKLNGRVARLMVTPMLRALKKIYGNLPYLEYLDSYRYPLSGSSPCARTCWRASVFPATGAWRSACCPRCTAIIPPSGCARWTSPTPTTTSTSPCPRTTRVAA